jgi:hypothetical protein
MYQIGAHYFNLERRDDGTYISTCVGDVPRQEKPVDEILHLQIPSNTKAGVEYTVDVYPDGLVHCNCTGWGFRHTCSHCDAAKYILYGEK